MSKEGQKKAKFPFDLNFFEVRQKINFRNPTEYLYAICPVTHD
jgi:hypothetical protein